MPFTACLTLLGCCGCSWGIHGAHNDHPFVYRHTAGGSASAHLDLLGRLFKSDLHTLDPVGLPAAHPQQPLLLGHSDGIALHMLHTPPGKRQVLQLLLAGLCLGHWGEGDGVWANIVCLLPKPAAYMASMCIRKEQDDAGSWSCCQTATLGLPIMHKIM